MRTVIALRELGMCCCPHIMDPLALRQLTDEASDVRRKTASVSVVQGFAGSADAT